jgi:hypothetical protein
MVAPGAVAQLQMPGDEVGVQMGEDHMRDAQPVLRGGVEVLIDVALGIDDRGDLRLLVADQVRGVRKGNSDKTGAGSCAKIPGPCPSIHAANFSASAPPSRARSRRARCRRGAAGAAAGGAAHRRGFRRARLHRRQRARPHQRHHHAARRSICVKHGRFVAVGSTIDIRNLANSRTQVVDAQRMTVVPGFIDCHSHPSGVEELYGVDTNLRTGREIQSAIRQKAERSAPEVWINGFMFDDTKLDRPLTRKDLDEATTEHPCRWRTAAAIRRSTTPRRFELAGITRDTPDPADGRFFREQRRAERPRRENAPRASSARSAGGALHARAAARPRAQGHSAHVHAVQNAVRSQTTCTKRRHGGHRIRSSPTRTAAEAAS